MSTPLPRSESSITTNTYRGRTPIFRYAYASTRSSTSRMSAPRRTTKRRSSSGRGIIASPRAGLELRETPPEHLPEVAVAVARGRERGEVVHDLGEPVALDQVVGHQERE